MSQKNPSGLKMGLRLVESWARRPSASPTVIFDPSPPPPLGHR